MLICTVPIQKTNDHSCQNKSSSTYSTNVILSSPGLWYACLVKIDLVVLDHRVPQLNNVDTLRNFNQVLLSYIRGMKKVKHK